jgi:hypothetical protein
MNTLRRVALMAIIGAGAVRCAVIICQNPASPAKSVVTLQCDSPQPCVQMLAPGDRVDVKTMVITHADGTQVALGTCLSEGSGGRQKDGGWIEDSNWPATGSVGSMTATFTVPALPSETGALLYFFPGAQRKGSLILQPVLQYGCNKSFGGDYWTIASWLFNNKGWSFYSQPIRVLSNDTIVGSMDSTCAGTACTWRITTTDSTTTQATTLVVDNLSPPPFNFYGGAFEAYNVTDCEKQYPASRSLTFHDIAIKGPDGAVIKPAWGNNVLVTSQCKLGVWTDTTTTTLKY